MILQGASAGGTTFWDALDADVIGDVLGTRAGTVWGLRLLDWVLLGGLLVALSARRALPVLRPASLGAAGQALPGAAGVAVLAPLAVLLGFLVLSPALAGHAGVTDPTLVLFPANVVHVLAMSIWIGGLALILLALPAATRALEPSDRTRLLSASLVALLTARARLRRRPARHRSPAVGLPSHLVLRPLGHGLRPGDPDQGVPARAADRARRPQPATLAAAAAPPRRRRRRPR